MSILGSLLKGYFMISLLNSTFLIELLSEVCTTHPQSEDLKSFQ